MSKRTRPPLRFADEQLDGLTVLVWLEWAHDAGLGLDPRWTLDERHPLELWRRYRPQLLAAAIRHRVLQYVVDFLDSGGTVWDPPDEGRLYDLWKRPELRA